MRGHRFVIASEAKQSRESRFRLPCRCAPRNDISGCFYFVIRFKKVLTAWWRILKRARSDSKPHVPISPFCKIRKVGTVHQAQSSGFWTRSGKKPQFWHSGVNTGFTNFRRIGKIANRTRFAGPEAEMGRSITSSRLQRTTLEEINPKRGIKL